ncbi:MAG: hypothetical protein LBG05_07965 [Treponema sp.]|nr:hypothetical protein [Treponema sp.]
MPARKEEGPALPKEGSVWMGLSAREHSGVFRYSMDGEHFTDVGRTLDSRMLSDEFDTLGFTGASVGMFCVDTVRYEAAADFKRFLYRPSISKGLERRKN